MSDDFEKKRARATERTTRERQIQIQIETERQRDRETDRQTHRDRETKRKTEKERCSSTPQCESKRAKPQQMLDCSSPNHGQRKRANSSQINHKTNGRRERVNHKAASNCSRRDANDTPQSERVDCKA